MKIDVHPASLIYLYATNSITNDILQSSLILLVKLINNDILYDEQEEIIVIPTLIDLCYNIHKQQQSSQSSSIQLQKSLLELLWNIQSIEHLDDWLDKLFGMLVAPNVLFSNKSSSVKQLSSRSLFGSFIYKIVTSYRLLKFDESFVLYESFVEYRELTRELYESYGGIIPNNEPLAPQQQNKGKPEDQDQELFNQLNQQLQSTIGINIPNQSMNDSNHNSGETLIPVPNHDLQVLLDNQINLLENYGTPTPKLLKDIMELMTSPNSNMFRIQNITFNNLPSYYYIKYLECLQSSNYNGAFESLHQYFDYMVSNNSKYFYHFALVSRASLHQFFGEDDKAMDAIEEAISVARENKDNSTLTYILSWLFNFMKNKPELWNRQKFYNTRNNSHLLDFLISKSRSVSLSLYSMSYNFETLQIMNSGSSGGIDQYMTSLLKAIYISVNDVKPTFVKSAEVAACVWARIGNPILNDDDDDIEVAYENLEKLKAGVIDVDHSLYNSLQTRSLIMLIKMNLMKGRFRISQEIIQVLLDNEIRDIELKHEFIALQIETQICLENYNDALKLISNTISNTDNLFLTIRLNLLKSSIFNQSGNHSRVISTTIQQIQLAHKSGFMPLIIEGLIILCGSFNALGEYQDSIDIFKSIMPRVLAMNNREYISRAYFELSQAWFGKYRQQQQSQRNEKLFGRALRFNLNT
ncbi:uncharacterized protein J8A68_004789 [[Candida] subhashii]|uniref:Anaphase-promoting complex subunit 5 n=1 Tax=[Candida] subhashii TaxID=561895 RepID=A0A8J5QA25_9ASCO|nr:uncharacterized protein J8A68_004789 [[Candida] subhashii]KAG7661731.1 hypothetical protein J8A68_004789 [[Candida] subhashii]